MKKRYALKIEFRYLGSKTWSIPGALCRIPVSIVKKVFDRSVDIQREMFGNVKSFKIKKNLDPKELKDYLSPACAWAHLFKSNREWIEPLGWKVISPSSIYLEGKTIKNDCIFDPQTGLQVSMIEKGDEIIFSFGACPYKYPLSNKKFSLSKWWDHKGALTNLMGFKPKIYENANCIIQRILQDPYFKNKKILLTGLCVGGSIAQYIGLKNSLQTVGFNTLPLGAGLQKEIGEKKLSMASKHITHILVKNEFLNEFPGISIINKVLSLLGFRAPGNFGKGYRIPSAYRSPFAGHAYYLGSIMQHLGHHKRSKPAQISLS